MSGTDKHTWSANKSSKLALLNLRFIRTATTHMTLRFNDRLTCILRPLKMEISRVGYLKYTSWSSISTPPSVSGICSVSAIVSLFWLSRASNIRFDAAVTWAASLNVSKSIYGQFCGLKAWRTYLVQNSMIGLPTLRPESHISDADSERNV